MRRHIGTTAVFATIAVLALTLAACGGSYGGSNSSTPRDGPRPAGCDTSGNDAAGLRSELRLNNGATNQFPPGTDISITLSLTNCSGRQVQRFYPSEQRYDFVVSEERGDQVGREVWRWSTDKPFAQVAGEEIFDPGESIYYNQIWAQVDSTGRQIPAGRYQMLGIDVGCEDEALQRCRFGPGVSFEIVP